MASPDFDRIGDARDDPQLYPALRFSGTLANDAGAGLELPIPIGAPVAVEVSDPNSAPRISAATLGPLADLLTKTWPKVDFESYAVARGFL
ncbi:MAG: hypothetical protein IPG45_27220 [Deltaproteobacteria bacterium]|nr:hypothetical protein [Deltaproteobacteria bacterium]